MKTTYATEGFVLTTYDNKKPSLLSPFRRCDIFSERGDGGKTTILTVDTVHPKRVECILPLLQQAYPDTEFVSDSNIIYNKKIYDYLNANPIESDAKALASAFDYTGTYVQATLTIENPILIKRDGSIHVTYYRSFADMKRNVRTTTTSSKYAARMLSIVGETHGVEKLKHRMNMVYILRHSEVRITSDWIEVAEVMNNMKDSALCAASCMSSGNGDRFFASSAPKYTHPDYGYEVTHPYQVFDYPDSKWEFAYLKDDEGNVIYRALIHNKCALRAFTSWGGVPDTFLQLLAERHGITIVSSWQETKAKIRLIYARERWGAVSIVLPYLDGTARRISTSAAKRGYFNIVQCGRPGNTEGRISLLKGSVTSNYLIELLEKNNG